MLIYKQFCLKFTQRATWTQTESNQEVTKMTDKHIAEHSNTACLGVDWPVWDVYVAYTTI